MRIERVEAYQVFDSRGNPTVEAEITLENGCSGRGMVPSGASTGQFEALELRDGDSARYRGKSVFRAISNIHREIAPAIVGMDVTDQTSLDRRLIELDGTPNKSRLGANAILAASMAAATAKANALAQPLYTCLTESGGNLLPLPEIQILGGGAHADWRIDVQDFLIIATGARDYSQTLEITHNVYHAAGELLKERDLRYGLADEGGYWPEFDTNEQALQVLVEAIERAGYTPGEEVAISLDIAASDLFDATDGAYRFALEERAFRSDEFAELLAHWCRNYPILSLEDPMADTDWSGWEQIYSVLGDHVQIIGDDLFTTNLARIEQGIQRGVANAVLIKLNQIGTVTETIRAIEHTQRAGWLPVISARSGETEDAFITHLAVATNAGQLKVGSFARSERIAKWNEGLRIARSLGDQAAFIGAGIYDRILVH